MLRSGDEVVVLTVPEVEDEVVAVLLGPDSVPSAPGPDPRPTVPPLAPARGDDPPT
ncbi:hypothetical protein BH24ACT4_BH24ACT4_15710 [soil metagenome]